MNDPREAKLPKWAQQELRSLRHSVITMTRRLEDRTKEGAAAGTRIWVNPYGDNAPVGRASEYDTVRFVLDDEPVNGDDSRVYIDVRIDQNKEGVKRVEIRSSDDMVISPKVSNVVTIRPAREW